MTLKRSRESGKHAHSSRSIVLNHLLGSGDIAGPIPLSSVQCFKSLAGLKPSRIG